MPNQAVQSALPPIIVAPHLSHEQTTVLLRSALQTVRIAFLTVGRLLSMVREEKIYAQAGCANLETYAREKLDLGRTSLYDYLRVFEWVAQTHPEWLDPEPGTFIPDLNDVKDLIWIEKDLARTDLPKESRATLVELKKKGLEGRLRDDELDSFRKRRNAARAGASDFLGKLRRLREEGEKEGVPATVLAELDSAIGLMEKIPD